MVITFKGIHMELTEAIKEFAEKKIEKLDKLFGEDEEITVILETSKEGQKAELHIDKQHTFISKGITEDLYASIDKAVDDMARQFRKYKDSHEKDIRAVQREEERNKIEIETEDED